MTALNSPAMKPWAVRGTDSLDPLPQVACESISRELLDIYSYALVWGRWAPSHDFSPATFCRHHMTFVGPLRPHFVGPPPSL
jgi:hypothetical protein